MGYMRLFILVGCFMFFFILLFLLVCIGLLVVMVGIVLMFCLGFFLNLDFKFLDFFIEYELKFVLERD